MRTTLSLVLWLALLGPSASAQVRCMATCEYYISSYRASDNAFIELVDISIDDGSQCSPFFEVAKYRVPVTSVGENETEARAELAAGCHEAASYLGEAYKASIYWPHIFAIHYCG